jgi:hypothetical protein
MVRCLYVLALFTLLLNPIGAPAALASQTPDIQQDERQIAALLDNMEIAVLAQNRTLYLSYVDQSDPIFVLEHSRWADEWAQKKIVYGYELQIRDLAINGDEATAILTIRWSLEEGNRVGQRAIFPAQFRRGKDGVWRYAGEYFMSSETEHFRVHALPGLESVAKDLIAELPDVYDHVTSSLEHKPSTINHIKLYDTQPALVANTLLTLPPITGWNEPGESLKLFARPGRAPLQATLAHEFTHFLSFDMAGTKYSRMPWWLEEGIAEYVGSHYWSDERKRERLHDVRDLAVNGKLAAWEKISNFKETPVDLWRYVYPQGYVFVRYVTESFGQKPRNAWLRAMATDMNISQASEKVLGLNFEKLHTGFLEWLKKQE